MNATKPRSPVGEGGFALSEVLIAILLIGAALLVLLTASASSFALQEKARQRLTAAGIANEMVERVRGLDFSVIVNGATKGSLAADPSHALTCPGTPSGTYWLLQCTAGPEGLGEEIQSTSGADSGCPTAKTADLLGSTEGASPHCNSYASNGITYRAYVFVTKAVKLPYRITAIVEWPESEPLRLQTFVYPTTGCSGGLSASLVSGACTDAASTTLTIPAPVVGASAPNSSDGSISLNLGGINLSWLEPTTGGRQLIASFVEPSVDVRNCVACGTLPADWGARISEGDSAMTVDSLDSTPGVPSAAAAVRFGIKIPTVSPPVAIASAKLGTNKYLVVTWVSGSGCPSGTPGGDGGATWFICGAMSAQAIAGASCLNGSSPCVEVSVKLPEITVCFSVVDNACSTSSVNLVHLQAGGTLTGAFLPLSRNGSRSSTVDMGYANLLTGGPLYPSQPLIRVTDGETRTNVPPGNVVSTSNLATTTRLNLSSGSWCYTGTLPTTYVSGEGTRCYYYRTGNGSDRTYDTISMTTWASGQATWRNKKYSGGNSLPAYDASCADPCVEWLALLRLSPIALAPEGNGGVGW